MLCVPRTIPQSLPGIERETNGIWRESGGEQEGEEQGLEHNLSFPTLSKEVYLIWQPRYFAKLGRWTHKLIQTWGERSQMK